MLSEWLRWQVLLARPLEAFRFLKLFSGGVPNYPSEPSDLHPLLSLAAKRKSGMPWEYILGRAQFMGRTFRCTPDTLIPREETANLVKAAVNALRTRHTPGETLSALEIGTGCGNIALSLALSLENLNVYASDISAAAVRVAESNVQEYELDSRITLLCGDLFTPYQRIALAPVDCIVCNPPYIPTQSLAKLPPEILEFEPRLAFDGGPYGIDVYLRLISESPRFLKPGGSLLFEIGEGQERLVQHLFDKSAFTNIKPLFYGPKVRGFQASKP